MLLFLLFLQLFASCWAQSVTGTNCNISRGEYDALECLYYAWDGQHWAFDSYAARWKFPSPLNAPCLDSWEGLDFISTSTVGLCTISSLVLEDMLLSGSFPSCIGNLPQLQTLNVEYNFISGSIPSEIALLTELTIFDVYENNCTGTIPLDIYTMTTLSVLNVGVNNILGTLSPSIGNLVGLTVLSLYDIYLSGTAPEELWSLTNLQYLYLSSQNNWEVALTSDVAKLKQLEVFWLAYTITTGTIPTEIGEMTSLTELQIGVVSLIGHIPSQLALLPQLQTLLIVATLLTGSIPTQLIDLTGLNSLSFDDAFLEGKLLSVLPSSMIAFYLTNNFLTGSVPAYVDLTYLQEFDIGSNLFSGTFPQFIFEVKGIKYLSLNNNFFYGSVPENIGILTTLEIFDLGSTLITGTIPNDIRKLRKLRLLDFGGTHLEGEFPPGIGDCLKLEVLYLDNNYLTGELPKGVDFHNFTRLQYVSLSYNGFFGNLTSLLTNLISLQFLEVNDNFFSGNNILQLGLGPFVSYLDFGNNKFGGPLPTNWSQFVQLQYILADNNYITGSIPNSIGLVNSSLTRSNNASIDVGSVVKSFIQFSMSNNQLVGTLPISIASHIDLSVLSLGQNYLIGTVPSEYAQLKSLITLNLSNNNLEGDLFGMFGREAKVAFPAMNYISIASNSFASSIPPALFMSSALKVVSLGINCFSGSLPTTICYSNQLQSLIMNALSSGSGCKFVFPGLLGLLFRGTFSSKKLKATIPQCLWNISTLQTLHMGGNGLTGTIPNLPIPASLTNIQLGNNALSGTLPLSIQEHGNFSGLGLQHNKLTGILIDSFTTVEANSSTVFQLDLYVNRLSGNIPKSLLSMTSLNVLNGNSFQCMSSSQLPVNDKDSKNYVCGSSSFDTAMYAWVAIITPMMLIVVLGLGGLYYVTTYGSLNPSKSFSGALEPRPSDRISGHESRLKLDSSPNHFSREGIIRLFLNTLQWYKFKYPSGEDKFPYTFQFLTVMKRASRHIRLLALSYVTISMTSYIIMKYVRPAIESNSIATQYQQYAWTTTATYMHGVWPVSLIIVYVFISVYVMASQINSEDWASTDEREQQQETTSSTEQADSRAGLKDRIKALASQWLFPIAFQFINLVVTISVNTIYVLSIETANLSPNEQVAIELLLSIFKLAWSATFIPWTIELLSNLSPGKRLMHQVVLLCVLIIVAPVIATSIGSASCFYNVFIANNSDESTYSYQFPIEVCEVTVNSEITVTGETLFKLNSDCGFAYSTYTVNVSTVPPFIYSYQCGSAILVNYIPVLVYSYAFSTILLPLMRMILLQTSQSYIKSVFSGWLYRALVENTVLDCDDVQSVLPTGVIKRTQTTLLAAFANNVNTNANENDDTRSSGLSTISISSSVRASHSFYGASSIRNPISSKKSMTDLNENNGNVGLSSSAEVSAIAATDRSSDNSTTSKANETVPLFYGSNIVGRRLLDFAVMITFGLAAPILGLIVALSVIVNTGIWRIMVGKYLTYFAMGNTIAHDRLEISSHGLLKGTVGGLWVVTFVVIAFWTVIIYDMISDIYGDHVGTIVSCCFFFLLPVALWASLKISDYIHNRKSESKNVNIKHTTSFAASVVRRAQSVRVSLTALFPDTERHSDIVVHKRELDVNSEFEL